MSGSVTETPALTRSLSGFGVFAVSFASVSVIMGIFATYDDMLRTAGPVGVWLFPLIGVGQLLIALVYAQFAARIPRSGSTYAWASLLAGPRVGWAFGWMALLCAATSPAAINIALSTQCLMPLFGMAPDETTGRVLAAVLLVVEAGLAIAATRIVGWVNSLSVGVELGILLLLGSALAAAVWWHGEGSTDVLFSHGVAPDAGYLALGGGLMASALMGLNTLVGFESASTMSEEATRPTRDVPRAIIGSVLVAAVLGTAFLVVLTLAIRDVGAVSASDSSVAEVMDEQFGAGLERPFLAAIAVAFFGAGMVAVAATARYIFAMARDGRFPAPTAMARVHPRTHTPVAATLLVVGVGLTLLAAMPGSALLQLLASGSIINITLYGMTLVLFLVTRRRLPRGEPGAFDLGRAAVPVAAAALVWVGVALLTVLTASTTVASLVIVVVLLAPGAAYFAYLRRHRPEVLDRVGP